MEFTKDVASWVMGHWELVLVPVVYALLGVAEIIVAQTKTPADDRAVGKVRSGLEKVVKFLTLISGKAVGPKK